MICCLVGFIVIVRFVYAVDVTKEILRFKPIHREKYDITEYCELDEYED